MSPGGNLEVINPICGLPGSGKSKVGQWTCKIIGPRHSIMIEQASQVAGKFNSNQEYMLFIGCEEAAYKDPRLLKTLKNLATAPTVPYEGKGKEVRNGESYVRLQMYTDKDWAAEIDAEDPQILHYPLRTYT